VTDIEDAAVAIRAGGLAVIPTDTVYGLACDPYRREAVELLSEVKQRSADQPIALVAGSVEALFDALPEIDGRMRFVLGELLPGPYTLVVPNPRARFPWLAGSRPDTLGVRVPAVEGVANTVFEILGVLAATSANLHGERDPARIADVPPEIRAVAAVVDGGELPGTASTVLDLASREPAVLREGAVASADALAAVHRLFAK
jgi:L-threonylcarbamoyladenylate synthase